MVRNERFADEVFIKASSIFLNESVLQINEFRNST